MSHIAHAVSEVSLRVSYIVDNIIILFYQLLYILLWVMSSFQVSSGFWRKGFVAIIVLTLHSMLVLGKYA